MIASLDRVNIGFAALQMNRDLGFSASVFGLGAGIFFWGYVLFEIPSNLVLAHVGTRLWIARIMITWGLLSVAMIFVKDSASFYVLRFLLGVAEAGFFPGILYYLAHWFPGAERARAVSWFMIASPISIVIGGPVAGLLLQMNGVLSLKGWQWLFLVEGAPAVALGFVVLFYLTETPDKANWLDADERAALGARIRAEEENTVAHHRVDLWQTALHPAVWQLAFISFAGQTGMYGLAYWLPQIIKSFSGAGDLQVGILSAGPYTAVAAGMVLVGWNSDRTGERFLHVAIPCAVAAIGFLVSPYVASPLLALLALTVAATGVYSDRGPFWALPGRLLTGRAYAAGVALINAVGAVGGFVGPYAMGLARDATGEFSAGLLLMAPLLLSGAIVTWKLRASPALSGGAQDV